MLDSRVAGISFPQCTLHVCSGGSSGGGGVELRGLTHPGFFCLPGQFENSYTSSFEDPPPPLQEFLNPPLFKSIKM